MSVAEEVYVAADGLGVTESLEKRFSYNGLWGLLQVWRCSEKTGEWQQEGPGLSGHTDWVRDVAWMPNLGLPCSTLASAGQDGKVLIWSESREVPGTWTSTLLHDFQVSLALSCHTVRVLFVLCPGGGCEVVSLPAWY